MSLSRIRSVAVLGCFAVLLAAPAAGQEWTRFRGSNGAGIGAAAAIPPAWSDKDYAWKVDLPGTGHSSPVLWGDRVFVTATVKESAKRIVLCLKAADGSVAWKHEYDSRPFRQHVDNSFASSTPAVDAKHVYVCWHTPDEYTLRALDHAGNEAWTVNLGRYVSQHGSGTSPIVVDDLVLLGNDQEGPESFLVAVEAASGKVRWKVPRKARRMSAATPVVYEPAGGPKQVIFSSKDDGLTGIDPRDGSVIWQVTGIFPMRTVGSAIVAGDLVIASCGEGPNGHDMVAVRAGTRERKAEVVWKTKRNTPYVPTPVAQGEHLFVWTDGGIVSCLKLATGEPVWDQRVGGNYYASPVLVNGHLFNVSRRGEVVAIAAAPVKPEVAGRTDLGEGTHATPAIAGGRMYVRTFGKLVCVGPK